MSEQRPDLKAAMASLAGNDSSEVRNRARRASESFAADGLRAGSTDGDSALERDIVIEADSANPTH